MTHNNQMDPVINYIERITADTDIVSRHTKLQATHDKMSVALNASSLGTLSPLRKRLLQTMLDYVCEAMASTAYEIALNNKKRHVVHGEDPKLITVGDVVWAKDMIRLDRKISVLTLARQLNKSAPALRVALGGKDEILKLRSRPRGRPSKKHIQAQRAFVLGVVQ